MEEKETFQILSKNLTQLSSTHNSLVADIEASNMSLTTLTEETKSLNAVYNELNNFAESLPPHLNDAVREYIFHSVIK